MNSLPLGNVIVHKLHNHKKFRHLTLFTFK